MWLIPHADINNNNSNRQIINHDKEFIQEINIQWIMDRLYFTIRIMKKKNSCIIIRIIIERINLAISYCLLLFTVNTLVISKYSCYQ